MFSVSASPFNSYSRQLYGGWNPIAKNANVANSAAADAFYGDPVEGPARYYRDRKWANLAIKYAPDEVNYRFAKAIMDATKNKLKQYRTDAAWKKAYGAVLKTRRLPFVRRPMTSVMKNAVWNNFARLGIDDVSPQANEFLALASGAPYSKAPDYPNVGPEVERMFETGLYVSPKEARTLRLANLPQNVGRYVLPEGAEAPPYYFGEGAAAWPLPPNPQ